MIFPKEKYVFALAKNSSAFINTKIPQSSYTCGQQYSPTIAPAPDLSVNLSWCDNNCAGYALYPPGETNAWALPLVTFILAAVIFTMTIPRRLGIHASHFSLPWLPWCLIPNLIISLIWDALILTLDTVFWVFAIKTATASFILSGLFEVIIDYKVTQYVSRKHGPNQLADTEIADLLTAVLAGNLNIEGIPDSVNPQQELKRRIKIESSKDHRRENIGVRLSNMLDSQVPFSTTVGAPVLLYIGSFGYSIVSLSGSEGDKDTARALAFGIWWMIIVHVSIISGSLLASNNPSSASIIYPKKRAPLREKRERRKLADKQSEMEDRFQAKVEACLPLFSSSYKNRYEPVWMWTRGKNKALWLRRTQAWENPMFRKRMRPSGCSWLQLIFGSCFLVLLPCALAFWIEYTTLPVGIGYRALTILVYACCQVTFVLLSAWSHLKAMHDQFWRRHNNIDKRLSVFLAIFFFLPSRIAAVFATFAGTLMQITGIHQNCWCAATIPSHKTVSLASDTKEHRRSSRHWSLAGYIAIVVLFVVTYCGWWGQRFLRLEFLERVKHLMKEPNETQNTNGAARNRNSTMGTSSISDQGNANGEELKVRRRRAHEAVELDVTDDFNPATADLEAAHHNQNTPDTQPESNLPIYQSFMQNQP